ncbi:hypothetical protein [Symbiopectobacterium purcellii]|uniref:Uncharacterized protein n=1 Tax=Symbiopectobacterium purcellii TaxID=2871826 RepID=A0ABX9ARX1_9ENTR|nr:hypothetical protein [Symbiopectobacterium purcellii]QZN97349.1 hypothetical protein K6K13_08405 [Symbiopectobacterium purcellii]
MAKTKPFSFAHLFGGGAKAAEEDEDKKSQKAKKAKGRAEEDDRDEDDTGAEEDEHDDPDAEDDDPDAEDDDNDTDAEDDDGDDRKDDKASRQARLGERRRCARIFGSKYAAGNISLAASLAFNTGMSSTAAIDVLKGNRQQQLQGSRRRSLDDRMQSSEQVRLGQDGTKPTGKSALVQTMTSLYNSTKGDK